MKTSTEDITDKIVDKLNQILTELREARLEMAESNRKYLQSKKLRDYDKLNI